jgi:hypothetical protein
MDIDDELVGNFCQCISFSSSISDLGEEQGETIRVTECLRLERT